MERCHMDGLVASILGRRQIGAEHGYNGFRLLWNGDRCLMVERSDRLCESTAVPSYHPDRVRQSSPNHPSQSVLRHHCANAQWKICQAIKIILLDKIFKNCFAKSFNFYLVFVLGSHLVRWHLNLILIRVAIFSFEFQKFRIVIQCTWVKLEPKVR